LRLLNFHFYTGIFVLFLLSLPAELTAQSSYGNISGTVTSSEEQPLEGVTVILTILNKGTVTDANGEFQFNQIKPGTYTLEFRFLGFRTEQKEVTITTGENPDVAVKLNEEAYQIGQVDLKGKSAIRRVNEQAYAVSSVSTKELYNSTSDAKEVLDRVPGVRVLQEGGLGSNLSFSLNGFSGDQVKFFLDGIPMDNFGSSLSLSSIPVNSIARIDVYKGVVPVWLGTDALGGAVNIITNQTHNFLDASYSFGSFNTHRASVNGAYTNAETGFTVRGNLNYNYSDNDYKVLAEIKDANGNITDTAEVRRFHDRYRSGTVKFETGFVNTDFADQLLLGVIASADDNQVQNGATMATVYGGITSESTSVIPTLKYKKKDFLADGLDVSLTTSYNITNTKNIDTLTGVRYNWYGDTIESNSSTDAENGAASLVTLDDDEFTSQFNTGYLINEKHALAFNYAYQYFHREVFDEENPERIQNQFPKSLNKHVLGLSYKFDYNQKWSTTLFGKAYFLKAKSSLQYGLTENTTDVYESAKENFGYGLATSYFVLPNLQLKTSYEHTYRMPWATEIFGDGLFVQPNADLGPEQSDNLNFGATYDFRVAQDHQFQADGTLIYRNSKDLIYQVVTVASPQTNYSNLAESRTVGVEGSLRYSWKDFFRLQANITYQNITDQADQTYSEYSGYQTNFNKGSRLPNTPYLFGNAVAGLTFKDVALQESLLNVNYYYNYVQEYYLGWSRYGDVESKRVIPQQSSHSLEVSYSLMAGKYNISLECRNFTNEMLYDKYRLQKPGRAFYLKLRYVL
tara:strand:+ start:215661 stop:218054 length:2394 start_codon:yes stop_codon:yes gene_type:complete